MGCEDEVTCSAVKLEVCAVLSAVPEMHVRPGGLLGLGSEDKVSVVESTGESPTVDGCVMEM